MQTALADGSPVAGQPAAAKLPPADGLSALACLVAVARRHGMHLSVDQLVHDNIIEGTDVSDRVLIRCAESAGLKARTVTLGWRDLAHFSRTSPAILRLSSGACLIVLGISGEGEGARAILQDASSDSAPLLHIDQDRLEAAWRGEAILVKRNYDIADETQPFGLGLVAAMIVREKWIVRDIAISAVVLGFLALSPIMFWRLLSDKVLYFRALNTFAVLCIAFGVIMVFEAVFAYMRQFLVVMLTTRIDVKLGTYVFDRLLNLPIDFFERTQVGRITHDVYQMWRIRTFLMGQVFGTVLDATTLIIFIPIMFFFSPLMTFVVLGTCGLMMAWLVLMLPFHRRRTSAVEAAESERTGMLIQTVHGIRTVKSLALDARQLHLWDIHTARVAKLRFAEGLSANLIQSVARPFERFAVTGSFAIGVYLALTSGEAVYLGALFAFLMLSQRVAGPLLQLAKLVNQYDEARIAVAAVANLVNQTPETGRSDHGVRNPLVGHIQFAEVTFKYQGASGPALQGVSFDVPAGATLGIMGRSGSGKTTITRLLQRLHSDYSGLIKIDGIDAREYDIDHLRRSLGVVLQENFLFSGTIRENITAGKSDATFDDIVRAARLAGAEEFIDRLPRGYETHIFEGSPNLSGGQRQRLAIARALIGDPRILILDEATSALDAESEAIVNDNIAGIAAGRTLIIISHRLSALMHADQILVLERGKVEDIGRHEELLERSDIYSDLWHQQTGYIVAASGRSGAPARGPNRAA